MKSAAATAFWARPGQLDFSRSKGAAQIQTVFGTAAPTTDACLALWDDKSSGARVLSADEEAALDLIQKRVGVEYKTAMPYVVDDVGEFCAYCELPLHDPPQLEHILPKSQYPTYSLDWENFLPGCIGCNSRKRETPLRSLVGTWLGNARCTPAECHREIRTNRYRWPDLDPVDGFFGVALHYADARGWTRCTDADSVDASVRYDSHSVVAGEVVADLPGRPSVQVAALVYDAAGDARTQATIDLCDLDRLPRPNDASDRRTLYRTRTWLDAVQGLRPLYDDGLPAVLPDSVRDAACGGFYWVWITVARLIDPALERLLVDGTKHALPGTDAKRLP